MRPVLAHFDLRGNYTLGAEGADCLSLTQMGTSNYWTTSTQCKELPTKKDQRLDHATKLEEKPASQRSDCVAR